MYGEKNAKHAKVPRDKRRKVPVIVKKTGYATTSRARPYNIAPAVALKAKTTKSGGCKRGKTRMDRVENAVKCLRQETNAALGMMTYRQSNTQQVLAANTQANAADIGQITTSLLENVLNNLKYFNPATPGTLTTASGSAGTYQRDILFKFIQQKVTVRNNYQTDINVRIYRCTPKTDTSDTPSQTWTAGIADQSNAVSYGTPNQYPTDYQLFNDVWASSVVLDTTLSPGQSAKFSNIAKDVEYDSAITDASTLAYQKKNKSCIFLAHVMGTLGHNTTGSTVGILPAGLDIHIQRIMKVQYNAGININFLILSDQTGVPEIGAVQSHQPASDNLFYEQA